MGKYRNLLVNIAVFGLSIFATKLVTFLLVPLCTYFMSTAEFGVTDMAITVVALMVPLATLSAGDAVLRYAIDEPNNANRYITLGFMATFLSCVVVACLLPLLDLEFFGGLGRYKLLFLLTYATNAFLLYHGNVARALNQLKLITWDAIVASLATAGLAVLFIAQMRLGAEGYFFAMIIGSFCGVAMFAVGGRHLRRITRPQPVDRELIRKMMVYALPLIPNALFWWVGTSINRFFITGMLGIAASGLFAAASKLPSLLNMVYSIFQQAWTLSAFQEFRKTDVSKFFSIIFILLNALMAVGAAVLTAITPWLASLLLQKEFYSAWGLIPVLLMAIYFNCLNAFFGSIFTTTLKTKALFTTTMAGAFANIALTWALLPFLGLYGPCIAMAASNLLVFVMRVASSRSIIRVDMQPVALITTMALLCCQSAVMALQPEGYGLFAWLFVIAICAVQAPGLFGIAKQVLKRYKAW